MSVTPQQFDSDLGNIPVPIPEVMLEILHPLIITGTHVLIQLPTDPCHPFNFNTKVWLTTFAAENKAGSSITEPWIYQSLFKTMVLVPCRCWIPFSSENCKASTFVPLCTIPVSTPRDISFSTWPMFLHPFLNQMMVRIADNCNRFPTFHISDYSIFVPQSHRQTLIIWNVWWINVFSERVTQFPHDDWGGLSHCGCSPFTGDWSC